MKEFDVVGLGYCTVDYLGIVPRYPGLDEKIQLLEFSKQGGGITATAMAAVGRLGGAAKYIGKTGDDDFGKLILAELAKDQVDTGAVVIQAGVPSQFSFVVVDEATGKRTIFTTTPYHLALEPSEVRREDVLAGNVLQVDAHHPQAAIQAATWANEAGVPVVMDAGSLRPGSEELIERTDALVSSELFARQFTGEEDSEKAARLMLGGRRMISAVTLGDRGCVYATAEGTFRQSAFLVEVVDTTGAGDVFHGAFSFGLSQGWPYREIVEFASAAAAIKCTELGGRVGIPTFPQALDFLRTRSENKFWRRARQTRKGKSEIRNVMDRR